MILPILQQAIFLLLTLEDTGKVGVSISDRLHGSQVSKARPGAPFDYIPGILISGHELYASISTLWSMPRRRMAGRMFPRKDFFRHGLHSTTRWSSWNPRCDGVPS